MGRQKERGEAAVMFSCVFVLWEVAQAQYVIGTHMDPHLHAPRAHARTHICTSQNVLLYVCVGPCSSQSQTDNHVSGRHSEDREGVVETESLKSDGRIKQNCQRAELATRQTICIDRFSKK